LKLFMRKNT